MFMDRPLLLTALMLTVDSQFQSLPESTVDITDLPVRVGATLMVDDFGQMPTKDVRTVEPSPGSSVGLMYRLLTSCLRRSGATSLTATFCPSVSRLAGKSLTSECPFDGLVSSVDSLLSHPLVV